ncbi:MAG TPA: tRNA (adenosine(37)-N6)-threonylcarbamoyltransferase complex ATPase subunit type 1 TsaE [Candidatus Saccharimonadales bacterium]|nr:tRNA (adenosine(37)-N6)-threonylcarbamoyltransferase complex ATPase subunit type 1 TsaE [Candidatus Saccharimonadales bacterium]
MKIGHKLRGGEAIELIGDLGAGKTAFVRGLAKGMGSDDTVRSPSFTISNRYRSGKLTMHHFDFHRLDGPGIIKRELAEILSDPRAVAVVEWGDAVRDVLPRKHLAIRITATGDESRDFEFSYPDSLGYLMPEEA